MRSWSTRRHRRVVSGGGRKLRQRAPRDPKARQRQTFSVGPAAAAPLGFGRSISSSPSHVTPPSRPLTVRAPTRRDSIGMTGMALNCANIVGQDRAAPSGMNRILRGQFCPECHSVPSTGQHAQCRKACGLARCKTSTVVYLKLHKLSCWRNDGTHPDAQWQRGGVSLRACMCS